MKDAGRKLMVPSKWVMEEGVTKGLLTSPGRVKEASEGWCYPRARHIWEPSPPPALRQREARVPGIGQGS